MEASVILIAFAAKIALPDAKYKYSDLTASEKGLRSTAQWVSVRIKVIAENVKQIKLFYFAQDIYFNDIKGKLEHVMLIIYYKVINSLLIKIWTGVIQSFYTRKWK